MTGSQVTNQADTIVDHNMKAKFIYMLRLFPSCPLHGILILTLDTDFIPSSDPVEAPADCLGWTGLPITCASVNSRLLLGLYFCLGLACGESFVN
jgi:hypothetical protein